MYEFADQIAMTGLFPDPRLIYDLTIEEISTTIRGLNKRTKDLQTADNMRIGTLCACVYNQNRQKRNDKIWKWTDFFPTKDLREPADPDELKEKCMQFARMINGS